MLMARIIGAYQDKPTGEGANIPYDHKVKVAIEALKMDWTEFMESLTSIKDSKSMYRLLTEHLSAALIDWAAKVLYDAVEGAPWDTGALRSSGTVDFIVGAGERTEDNVIHTQADDEGNFDIRVRKHSIKTPASKIGCKIYFDRADKGLDIALWAHEVLLPAKNRPSKKARKELGKKVWYARNPGTGPKYLENAFKRHESDFHLNMSLAVQKAIKVYNRLHGQKVRKK